jgi:hypothetical protein
MLIFDGIQSPWTLPIASAEEVGVTEYEVKAAWLLNFARFIDWPSDAFASPADPIVVGVVGKDPFGPHLERTFAGKNVKGRTLAIKRLAADQDLKGCHILFLSSSEKKRHREILEKLKNAPVLTVGEADELLDQGGVISFVRKEGTVRFAINLNAAQRAQLKASANLLKVALSVKGKYD